MIYLEMYGRLGNQLFRYAAARSLRLNYHPEEKLIINFNQVYKLSDHDSSFDNYLKHFNVVSYEEYRKRGKVIFNESSLSLSSIEDLIYQRNCMQSLSEKVFESLQLMTKRLNELINSFKENGNSEEFKKDLMNDNIKLRELLVSQIEYSDNFRINTEKTLNRIKDEFRTMVKELETLKKKSNKDEQINSIGGPVKKSGNTNNNNINNQKVNFSASSTNINNQGNDNNYSLPLKVNLIK